jgi:hypothetical protein
MKLKNPKKIIGLIKVEIEKKTNTKTVKTNNL